MLYYVSLTVVSVAIILFLRFLFAPYINWRKQMKAVRSLKSKDDVSVIAQGTTYVYQDYLAKTRNERVEISIVIPAFNEQQRLGKTLGATIEFFYKRNFEIIVINDASKDATKDVALSFQKYGGQSVNLKVITYTRNRGKGGAVRLGMLAAQGEKVLMMDADLATDLNDYPSCERQLLRISKDGLGLITGSRRHLQAGVQADRKFHRKLTAFVSNFIVNVICGINLKVYYLQMIGHLMRFQIVHQEHFLNFVQSFASRTLGFRR